MMRLFAFAVLVTIVGCTGDDEPCALYDRGGVAEIQAVEYRDPYSGTCQAFGGYPCDDACGPCPDYAYDVQAQPDWAMCYGSCEGLNEPACKETSGCRAIYENTTFFGCWGTAPSGPVQGGDCTTFDAYECSRHDDCVANHDAGPSIGNFLSCGDEETITGDPGSCVGEVSCDALPPNCPAGTIPGRRNGCWTGYCIPYAQCDQLPSCSSLGEAQCIARTDCSPLYQGNICNCTMNGCTCQSWTFDVCEES
jgi:hypothetical protein